MNLKIRVKVLSTKAFINGEFLEYISKEGFDIVNFHGAKAFVLNKLISKKLSIASAATVHSNYRQDFLNSKLKHILFTPLSILGLRSFKYFICVSDYIRNLLEGESFDGTKIVVYNGFEFKEEKLEDSIVVRNSLGILESDFVYIMVARLHPVKNHLRLIKAFNKLHLEFRNTKLLLIGEGSLLENLKALGNEGVVFAGFKENVLDYINASDISVLSSLSEGGSPPLVILESAAVKKPAAVSNAGDMPNIINSSNGYVFDPYSEEDIYHKLKAAYINKNTLPEMGNRLYMDVIDRFSMDNFCSRYYDAYKSIIEDYNGK
ncbi:MAG: glycosyltransferase family 4 protein [Solirubrobacterales bacterium]